MTNIPHSTLTGSDLHESKGAALATQGQVAVANGSGNAVFQKLDASSLIGTGNPFGAQLFHVSEQQPSGTSSATASTTGSFITTALNTILTNEIASATLTTSQINLPAGTYFIDALIPWTVASPAQNTFLKPQLYNVTASSVILPGIATQAYGTTDFQGIGHIRGRFQLGVASTLVIQHRKSAGNIGPSVNQGTECYTEALIFKVL